MPMMEGGGGTPRGLEKFSQHMELCALESPRILSYSPLVCRGFRDFTSIAQINLSMHDLLKLRIQKISK